MRIQLLFVLLVGLTLASCQQEPTKQTTPSGFEYVLHTDAGGEEPVPGDYVVFQAYMRNGDSIVYSSRSQPRPPMFQIPTEEEPGRPPSPVEEVIQEMSLGDSATVYINIDTMQRKPNGFEGASVMYYDLVIEEVKSAEEYAEEQNAKMKEAQEMRQKMMERMPEIETLVQETREAYNNNNLGDELQSTDSGLKYVVHEAGAGPQAEAGKLVSVHYYGTLLDGKMFDNSFQRGQPIELPLGQGRVIPGWEEGIALFKEGAKATLFIPSDLGYGEAGSPPDIPGGAELMFYVEIADVE